MRRPVVDTFAAQRRTRFTEVNAHLMRAARLQPALDEREFAQRLDDADVRHSVLAFFLCAAAAPAVSAVAHQPRFDAARTRSAATPERRYNRSVEWARNCRPRFDSAAGVRAKTTRPLVSLSRRWTARTFGSMMALGEQIGKQVLQRRRQKTLSALAELRGFMRMAHRRQSRRLVHDNQMGVGMDDGRRWTAVTAGVCRRRLFDRNELDDDVLTRSQRFTRIDADGSGDADLVGADEAFDGRSC